MAFTQLSTLNTLIELMLKTNELVTFANQISANNTMIANNKISGTLFNLVSNNSSLVVVSGSPQSGETTYLNLNLILSASVNDTNIANIASANTVNIVNRLAVAGFEKANAANVLAYNTGLDVANVTLTVGSAYNKANAANLLAYNNNVDRVNDIANTQATAAAAFNKANAANVLAFTANATAAAAAIPAFNQANAANQLASNIASVLYAGGTQNASVAFNTIKQNASVTQTGVIQLATPEEFRQGTIATKALTPNTVFGNLSILTAGANVLINLANGYDFGQINNNPLVMTTNQILNNPSGIKTGQKGLIWFVASGGTRTLTLGNLWVLFDSVEVGPYSIASGEQLAVAYACRANTAYVTSILRKG